MPLRIVIPEIEGFDEETDRFLTLEPAVKLTLEHSLLSISKWEAKWKKPFLSRTDKTVEETLDYIRCMTLTQNVPESVYSRQRITPAIMKQIKDYMDDPMTATVFRNKDMGPPSREVYTAEIIYYYMFTCGIPLEMERWHIRRLFTLLRVFSEKNQKPKKRSSGDILKSQMSLNERNRRLLNTKG